MNGVTAAAMPNEAASQTKKKEEKCYQVFDLKTH
jgi:hypothetical protein